jgi:tetratricopeptide (TPR) repeat protein
MKRNFLFFSFLFLLTFVFNISTLEAKGGQGISYYDAGFPQVAKPLLIEEIAVDSATRAECCFYLGNIYFGENKSDSAAFYFNKGLVANPLYPLNTIGLAMLKIKSSPAEAELTIVNTLKEKANKKNVDLFIAAANAYLVNGLIDKASFYQDKAKGIKPKYAKVSVLLGDIELAKGNTGTACGNYELAILFDESCKEAYIKYARAYKNVNTPLAIEKLGVLKQKEPTFLLVDRELADIYYATNDFKTAAQLYENYLQSGNSNAQDLTKYAMTLFLNNDFAKSLEVATLGLQKTPRSPAFNRLAMWNNVDLKKYDDAIKSADLFFNKSDKPDLTYLDYRYYGQALRETKQYDLAIPQYEKALKMDSTKIDLWKDMSDMYNEKGDVVNSISTYNTYLGLLGEDKRTADVMMPLGKLYYGLGNNAATDPIVKKDALIKADTIFAQVATLEPTGYRGNFWRARTNFALDPETTQGLAKPFYEQTVSLVESKVDAARYNSVIMECSRFLGYYYFLQKDYTMSNTYWNKILTIEPTNEMAKNAIAGIDKALKGKK